MKNIKSFDELNEGWKNWLSVFFTLISIGFIDTVKAEKLETHEKKQIIDSLTTSERDKINNLSKSDIDSLYIISMINTDKYTNVNNIYTKYKKNTTFQDLNLLEFIDELNKSNIIKANIYFINVPISNDISVDVDISDKLRVSFMTNPMFTSIGLKMIF